MGTSPATSGLGDAVERVFDEMVDTRRQLHEHPELGFEEYTTTALIRSRLGALGLTDLAPGLETGAAYALQGGRPGGTVVLRADIDALPVHETVATPFASRVEGLMHACGHDVHTAALLGVAEVLQQRAEDLAGRFVLVFQPAEEKLNGAQAILDAGVLDGLEDARLLGFHVASPLPVGMVGVRAGVAMAEVRSLRIHLHGPGGHGAVALEKGNVVLALALLTTALQSVVDGLSFEGVDCMCTAGMVQAGTAPNVIPDHAVLAGTLRTFTEEQQVDALGRLEALCSTVAANEGVTVEVETIDHCRAVVNDPGVSQLVGQVAAQVLGPDLVVTMPPVAPSDDVSELMEVVPGCYFMVGGGLPDGTSGVHHAPDFAVDDASLRVGASVLTAAAVALAARTAPPS